jgi:hypothetical protein
MVKLEIYDGNKTYMFPNLSLATPEVVMAQYAAVNFAPCVIMTDSAGEMFCSIEPLNAMRSRLGVDESLSVDEALVIMEEIINTPPVPMNSDPTPEERIAAALEFQNVSTLSDVE